MAPGVRAVNSEQVALAAGISYRQLDHWVRRGWVRTVGDPHGGSGTSREFTDGEAGTAAVMARLVRAGFLVERAAELARTVPPDLRLAEIWKVELGYGLLLTVRRA
jgi:hypothetical protein